MVCEASRPKVSIAMATFNGAVYLPTQLKSIMDQHLAPCELVVCDDGSDDETVDILRKFANEAPFPVRLTINDKRLGATRNFEKAARLCDGEIILFCDQDDRWLPDKTARIVSIFQSRPAVMVTINDAFVTDEKLVRSKSTQQQNWIRGGWGKKSIIAGCCSAHRKSWQEIAFPTPSYFGYDGWVNGLAIYLGVSSFIDSPLQDYRRHRGNISKVSLSDPNLGLFFWIRYKFSIKKFDISRQMQFDILDAIEERIRKIGNELNITYNIDPSSVVDRIAREKRFVQCSRQIRRLPRRKRFPLIWGLWLDGGYGPQWGFKGALRDLLFPVFLAFVNLSPEVLSAFP